MNEAFVAFWSTSILICRTSHITLCGKSCDLERKYVVLQLLYLKNEDVDLFFFILDSLSAQMNVPNTKFARKTMKHLNHNASTLSEGIFVSFCLINLSVESQCWLPNNLLNIARIKCAERSS